MKSWDETLEEYKAEGNTAIEAEAKLATLELDKRDYLAEGVKQMVGAENVLTHKPHSQTSAEKEVREHPDYRGIKERIIKVRADMQTAALNASAARLQCQRGNVLVERMTA